MNADCGNCCKQASNNNDANGFCGGYSKKKCMCNIPGRQVSGRFNFLSSGRPQILQAPFCFKETNIARRNARVGILKYKLLLN